MIKKIYIGDKLASKAYYGNDLIWEDTSKRISIDFVNNIYIDNGVISAFNTIFNFTRASKAWLALESIEEFGINTPRITPLGLLLERSSTNHILYSTLPETAAYTKGRVTYENGKWVSTVDGYLYPNRVLTADTVSISTRSFNSTPMRLFTVNNVPAYPTIDHNYSYLITTGLIDNHLGVSWRNNVSDAVKPSPMYWQVEKSSYPSSVIVTQGTPVTRAADNLQTVKNILSIKGDWDTTLTLTVSAGKLVHSGYGRIRTMTITYI